MQTPSSAEIDRKLRRVAQLYKLVKSLQRAGKEARKAARDRL